MKKQSVYWWASGKKDVGNFGDILNPLILEYFNIPFVFVKSWKNNKIDIIAVGSIIDKAQTNSVVLGAGVMSTKTKINPRADFRLVRGPITRECIIKKGGHCPENFGDPGLLLPLLCEESKKEHDIGFIPHFIEYESIKTQFPNEYVIDIMDSDPLNVAKKLTKCRAVVSSSLHGIIAAHAYGIPAAWAISNDLILKFSDTKFLDYFSSIEEDAIKSSFENPQFITPKSIKIDNIIKTFSDFSYEIQQH